MYTTEQNNRVEITGLSSFIEAFDSTMCRLLQLALQRLACPLTRLINVRYFHRPPYVRAPGCRSDISREQLVRSVKTYQLNIARCTHKHDLHPRPDAAIFRWRYFRTVLVVFHRHRFRLSLSIVWSFHGCQITQKSSLFTLHHTLHIRYKINEWVG